MTDVLGGTVDAAVPDYPMARAPGCPFAPPPEMLKLHAEKPVSKVRLWDGSSHWLVTRYEDQRALYGDQRLSVDTTREGFPYLNAAFRETASKTPPSFLNMDDPDHARIRRMVTGPFTVKRIEALRPAIQRMTDDLIDRMLAGPKPVDLVEALALPLPSLVICELLGVPYEDHEFFQSNSRVGLRRDVPAEDVRAAFGALFQYLDRQLDAKLADPAEDMLSELAARMGAGDLSRMEAAMLGILLLGAGHETSANMIALGALAFMEHPDQLAVVRDTDDPKVLASAAEEMLRYLTVVHTGQRRLALEDLEIGGQLVRAGEGVIIPGATGNWEADVFPDPELLDVHRDARRHMAFGFGIHQCLGQQLARLELQIVYGTLFRRVPTLRLATELDKVPFKDDGIVYGVYELPVTW
ncbi:cytochrome P450 [Streptomyces pseudovenezuelae]|uniref:Cytochrome P450 n=1 Tax=Streptomyces pseudovenezuelae TaxID=67350 RepID=A0ABT6LGY5_9ACTN|nr:cytochrome P450 [Streptomyces pseudovenezuelae]MDH6214886.1 cytochrome P450 [Streptomyces pseudovenezuelae]